jgi:two-component system sensor histidine kinase AlgZ
MGAHSMDKRSLTNEQYFLPDMCRAKNVLYLTLISQLLAITLALNTSFLSGDFWNALSLNALFILWVAFICAGVFCTFKQQINSWPAINISLFMFFSINITTLLMTWLITSLLPQLELSPPTS